MNEKDYKPYTAKRWTEPIKPIPIGPIEEFTEEQKRKIDSDFTEILREYGVIHEGEIVKGEKVIKK